MHVRTAEAQLLNDIHSCSAFTHAGVAPKLVKLLVSTTRIATCWLPHSIKEPTISRNVIPCPVLDTARQI